MPLATHLTFPFALQLGAPMNRFSFSSPKFLPALLIAFGGIASASGQVTLSPDPPAACSSLAENLSGLIGSRIFDEDENANHGRGQLFNIANAGPSEMLGITIRQAGDQTFVNDTLTVIVFQGDEDQWSTGTGHTTAANGTDFFVGTTVTPVYTETFTLNGLHAANDFIDFNFAAPVAVDDGDYGFLMIYNQIDGAETSLFYLENQAPAGESNGRLSLTDVSHSGPGSRGFHYAVRTIQTSAGLGDVNNDFTVDFLDITPFIAAVSNGTLLCEADVNQDGAVDFLDIVPFIAILSGS